jgi:hypothetical protein
MELEAMGVLLDYPNKVFREVETAEDWYIAPSSPAVSLIISENIQNGAGVRYSRKNWDRRWLVDGASTGWCVLVKP